MKKPTCLYSRKWGRRLGKNIKKKTNCGRDWGLKETQKIHNNKNIREGKKIEN